MARSTLPGMMCAWCSDPTTATAAIAIVMAAAVSPADRTPVRIRGLSQAAAPRTASHTAITTAG